MIDGMSNQENILTCFIFTLCLLITGCSNKSNEQNESTSIVGTWHCPAPDKPPLVGEWGPTRLTFTLHKEGMINTKITIESEDGLSVPESSQSSGKYKIMESTLETTIEKNVEKYHYALNKDSLVLRLDNGEVYNWVREE